MVETRSFPGPAAAGAWSRAPCTDAGAPGGTLCQPPAPVVDGICTARVCARACQSPVGRGFCRDADADAYTGIRQPARDANGPAGFPDGAASRALQAGACCPARAVRATGHAPFRHAPDQNSLTRSGPIKKGGAMPALPFFPDDGPDVAP